MRREERAHRVAPKEPACLDAAHGVRLHDASAPRLLPHAHCHDLSDGIIRCRRARHWRRAHGPKRARPCRRVGRCVLRRRCGAESLAHQRHESPRRGPIGAGRARRSRVARRRRHVLPLRSERPSFALVLGSLNLALLHRMHHYRCLPASLRRQCRFVGVLDVLLAFSISPLSQHSQFPLSAFSISSLSMSRLTVTKHHR
mmetsp:Transcript_12649/g.21631  ORF Transcript_12649/g.21631 Transcript_12649/m.21631 type:complete len:200 (-) Transcript_12649:130-729(-)